MKENLIAIGISILASFLYELIKKAVISNRKIETHSHTTYSKKYISSVKKEFYIGFFSGILLILIPNTKYEFLNIAIKISSFFMLFIALMGFMCSEGKSNHTKGSYKVRKEFSDSTRSS